MGARISTTPSSRAFSAGTLSLSRTAFTAHSTLRWRCLAIASANAAVSFSILRAISAPPAFSGSSPPGPTTGCAAPMLVPGAMPATWEARVTNTPAEPARAPGGPTQTSTGTGEARKALTMSRVDSRAPPGVSTTTRSAPRPRFRARSTHSAR